MSLESGLYTLLSGNAGVTALVSTRIYPTIAPTDVTRPFIVYNRTGSEPADLAGRDAIEFARVTIDCYADDVDEAATIGRAVMAAIEDSTGSVRGAVQSDFDTFDEGSRLYLRSLDTSLYFPAN